MNAISIDLPKDLKKLELVCLSDSHIGDPFANEQAIMEQIRYIAETDNCYCILNGDLINNATKNSPSVVYTETLSPMEQLVKVAMMLKPIAPKVFAITQGNHERRTARDSGIDIARLIARELGLEERYSEGMAYIFLRFGDVGSRKHNKKQRYTILVTHGSGGGRTIGGKANRLSDLVSIADADLYLYGHTHQNMAFKEGFMRVDSCNDLVTRVDRLFVNAGAFLDWGGYAEQAQYHPSIISTPHIFLDGTKRAMTCSL